MAYTNPTNPLEDYNVLVNPTNRFKIAYRLMAVVLDKQTYNPDVILPLCGPLSQEDRVVITMFLLWICTTHRSMLFDNPIDMFNQYRLELLN